MTGRFLLCVRQSTNTRAEMKPSLLKTETLRHQQAFEYYCELGDKRSLQSLAKHYAISHTAARQWSASFGWADRVIQRDEIIATAMAKHAINKNIKQKQKMINTCEMILDDFAKRAKPTYTGKNKIIIKSGSDYERIAKLQLLLSGEVTDRVESIEVVFSSGANGEDWTKRDAPIGKPNIKDRDNGAEA